MSDARLNVDVEEVGDVVAYYRSTARALGDAATEMTGHEFGGWAIGDAYRDLGDRYRTVGHLIARRLSAQADAAAAFSDDLDRALTRVAEGDAEASRALRRTADGHRSGHGGGST